VTTRYHINFIAKDAKKTRKKQQQFTLKKRRRNENPGGKKWIQKLARARISQAQKRIKNGDLATGKWSPV